MCSLGSHQIKDPGIWFSTCLLWCNILLHMFGAEHHARKSLDVLNIDNKIFGCLQLQVPNPGDFPLNSAMHYCCWRSAAQQLIFNYKFNSSNLVRVSSKSNRLICNKFPCSAFVILQLSRWKVYIVSMAKCLMVNL